jgi:hypothetical protein
MHIKNTCLKQMQAPVGILPPSNAGWNWVESKREEGKIPSQMNLPMFQLAAEEAQALIIQVGRSKGRGGRRHFPQARTP